MLNTSVQMKGFPLAGLLSNVLVRHRSKAEIGSGEMMTNDDIFTQYKYKKGPSIQVFSDSIKKSAATSTPGNFLRQYAHAKKIFSVSVREGEIILLGGVFGEVRAREWYGVMKWATHLAQPVLLSKRISFQLCLI